MKINSTSHLLASLKIPVVDCVFEIDCAWDWLCVCVRAPVGILAQDTACNASFISHV